MQRMARDRLLDLRQQQIVIAHDEIANGLAPVGSGMKLGGGEPRGRARQLHDHSPDAVFFAEPGARADHSRASDGCGLDGRAALHDHHQRDHAVMREVDALDLFRCVVQHRAALKRDGAQMRRQQCKVVGRQCR